MTNTINTKKDKVLIIGAGPAGLSAAYELLKKSDKFLPVIFEKESEVGGISKTVEYNGYKIDYGPHRFFTKSDRVSDLWEELLPRQGRKAKDDIILDRAILLSKKEGAPDPEKEDKVFLFKNRTTRILFLKKFFNYPISLNIKTVVNLGIIRMFKIGLSYAKARIFPIKNENSLEDFLINRFGKELYKTFFKDYTEKVWGVDCRKISPEWGAQRIKGLSISKAIIQAFKNILKSNKIIKDQSNIETSLINYFYYPKLGAGQMYSELAKKVTDMGGKIYTNKKVIKINKNNNQISSVIVEDKVNSSSEEVYGKFLISSMPITHLIERMNFVVPQEVRDVASNLVYRDYISVGLLFNKMKINNDTETRTMNDIIPDNWVYIQERGVKMGRLDIFNNFSPYLLKDINKVWLSAEYFCNKGDYIWSKSNKDLIDFATDELAAMNIVEKDDLVDGIILRMEKAYPSYFGSYNRFDVIKKYLNLIENIYLIGRNGMHKYNNMDHSILSGMVAADNIINGEINKDNLWNLNMEKKYHESK